MAVAIRDVAAVIDETRRRLRVIAPDDPGRAEGLEASCPTFGRSTSGSWPRPRRDRRRAWWRLDRRSTGPGDSYGRSTAR